MDLVLLVLGIACLLYGVTILLTFSGTSFFMVWLVMGAALVACARLVAAGAWDALPAPARRGICAVAGTGIVLIALLAGLIMRDARREPPAGLDYLIVLGAQVHPNGPSVVLRYRLDAAYDYLVANPGTRCIVSGGQGPNEPFPEAEGMAAYLVSRGIDEGRILREPRSETTVENIAFSRELMDDKDASVGIVTNNFHVFRATRIARKQGFGEVAGVPGDTKPWYLPNNLLRECLGVVKDLLAGNMTW